MRAARPIVILVLGLACAAFLSVMPGSWTTGLTDGPVTDAEQMDLSALWLAPSIEAPSEPPLARAIRALEADNAGEAESLLRLAIADPIGEPYVRIHLGRALLAQDRPDEAADQARRVLSIASERDVLQRMALWLLADAAEAAEDWPEAVTTLRMLEAITAPDHARAAGRLGRAAERAGQLPVARAAYETVFYEFPLADAAREAAEALDRLPVPVEPLDVDRALARAERLFTGRRYRDAREAFDGVRSQVSGTNRRLVDLRVAQCDFHTGRYSSARQHLRPLLADSSTYRVEAEFYDLSALGGLGQEVAYIERVNAFVDAYPTDPLAERALDELGTYLIVADEDDRAAAVFADLYARYPAGAYAGRAAWKAGWRAYRRGDHAATIRFFESAAATFPRADYRPSWLYWAGRSHEHLGAIAPALQQYRQVVLDYRNSYYGREATRRLEEMADRWPAASGTLASTARSWPESLVPGQVPSTAADIRRLLELGLYGDAVAELRQLAPEDEAAPVVVATIAYGLHRLGQLRPAITRMRRAYPQFMASGGEALPLAIRRVIFPIAYWDLLQRYAATHDLDRHLLAAQVAQESTFQADVRSPANAYGLMQILPATGRRYAQRLGLRGFSTGHLNDPETNVQIGTAYLAELIDMLGDVVPALAAYNAGERRVEAWQAERPGLARDEFIDDIPFPETQFYVKRVIGTADDYRELYPSSTAAAVP